MNGSEDDITLTRLDPVEGETEVKKALRAVKAAGRAFKEQSKVILEKLATLTDWSKVRGITTHFSYMKIKGFDIDFALPDLVTALARHPHVQDDCDGQWIYWLLRDIASSSEENRQKLLDLLAASALVTPEMDELVREFSGSKEI